jgi:hypothetical protein
MSTDTALSSASLQFAEAHTTHYQERDRLGALRAYCRVIASYPSAPEAEHSRTQIRNIMSLAVPDDDGLSAQTELALRLLQAEDDATSAP